MHKKRSVLLHDVKEELLHSLLYKWHSKPSSFKMVIHMSRQSKVYVEY